MRFVKLEGCGNSFIITSSAARAAVSGGRRLDTWDSIAKRVCDPHFGIGSDGLMVVEAVPQANLGVSADKASAIDFNVRMFNPDGSSMGMCGNGIRCVCRFLFMEEMVAPTTAAIRFDVEGRVISCFPSQEGRLVKVDMGAPVFSPEMVPFNADGELIEAPLQVGDKVFAINVVSMGNPHCVLFPKTIECIDLKVLGPAFENHAIFPKRTNVEFVQVVAENRIKVKVWERGAGATLACGTGACASVVAGVRSNRCSRETVVELPGGELLVHWDSETDHVFMTGPAREICCGEISHGLVECSSF